MDHSEPLLLTLDSHHRSHSFLGSSPHCHHEYPSHHLHHLHHLHHPHPQETSPTSDGAASSSSTSPNTFYLHSVSQYSSYTGTAAQTPGWETNGWECPSSGLTYSGEVSNSDQVVSSSPMQYAHHFSPYSGPFVSNSSASPPPPPPPLQPPLHCENSQAVSPHPLHHHHHHHHVHQYHNQYDLSRTNQPVYHSLHSASASASTSTSVDRSIFHPSVDDSVMMSEESALVHHQSIEYSSPGEYDCDPVTGSTNGRYISLMSGNCSFNGHTSGAINCPMNETSVTGGSVNSMVSSHTSKNVNNMTSGTSGGSGSNRVGRGNKLAPVNPSKKERRRTLSINCAFSNLRERIPNVPVDTKLSKIKTLRLATNYISYLMNQLNDSDNSENGSLVKGKEGFKVDLQRFKRSSRSASAAAIAAAMAASLSSTSSSSSSCSSSASSSLPLTSSTYRSQSCKISARAGSSNCTSRKGTTSAAAAGAGAAAFHVHPGITCNPYYTPECGTGLSGGNLLTSTSSSVIYPSFSSGSMSKASTSMTGSGGGTAVGTAGAAAAGATVAAGAGGKGRTGWPEHVWELELKNASASGNDTTGVVAGATTTTTTTTNVTSSSNTSSTASSLMNVTSDKHNNSSSGEQTGVHGIRDVR